MTDTQLQSRRSFLKIIGIATTATIIQPVLKFIPNTEGIKNVLSWKVTGPALRDEWFMKHLITCLGGIVSKNNPDWEKYTSIQSGYIDDDFVKDQITLVLSYDTSKPNPPTRNP